MPERLGQHFLRPGAAAALADLIAPQPDDVFLEIGPGRGAITLPIALRARRVVAIEIDPALIPALRDKTAAEPRIEIRHLDALAAELEVLVPPGARLVGNLPYAISSPLLRRILDARAHFKDAHLMLQKEVAERVASPPGSKAYGILSVLYGLWADVAIVQRLRPADFDPPPRVDSAVIHCQFRETPRVAVRNPDFFRRLVQLCFARRRQTVANNLRLSYPDFKQYLKSAEISEVRRAETLTVEEFARLADVLPD
jgi:16S rRNA (adenine1518-N6/adenine1519-N6)-dimethyltransferase